LPDRVGLFHEQGLDLLSDQAQAVPEVAAHGGQALPVSAVEVAVAPVGEPAREGDEGERGVEFLMDAALRPCVRVVDHGLAFVHLL